MAMDGCGYWKVRFVYKRYDAMRGTKKKAPAKGWNLTGSQMEAILWLVWVPTSLILLVLMINAFILN